jgi:hypothetical protein
VDTNDIDWLRANRHQIRIATTAAGEASYEFDGYDAYDAMEEYLSKILAVGSDAIWLCHLWDNPTSRPRYRIIFRDLAVSPGQLQELVDRI